MIVFLVQKEDRFVVRTMLDLREHMGKCGGVDPVLSNGEIYAIWSSLYLLVYFRVCAVLCDCVFLEEEKIGHRIRARTWNNKMLMHKHRRMNMLQLKYASECRVWRVDLHWRQ